MTTLETEMDAMTGGLGGVRNTILDHDRRLRTVEQFEEHVQNEVARIEKLIDSKLKDGGSREKQPMVHRRGVADVPKLTGEVGGYVDTYFDDFYLFVFLFLWGRSEMTPTFFICRCSLSRLFL